MIVVMVTGAVAVGYIAAYIVVAVCDRLGLVYPTDRH
jgi:hypothetical protein